jgi:hypothetical protein
MKRLKGRLPALATAAIGVGAALAFAVPAGAAVSVQSQSPPVQAAASLGRKATLDANGAVVFPSVKLLCPAGAFASLSVTVTENVGGRIAKGSGFRDNITCTGRQQSFRVAVTPDQRPFRKGVAFGQLVAFVCAPPQCNTNLRDEHNIQIVNK